MGMESGSILDLESIAVQTVQYATAIQWQRGGETVAWISGRVKAGFEFTFTSATLSVWAKESLNAVNGGVGVRIYKYNDSNFPKIQEIGSLFEDTTELITSASERTITCNITDTEFVEDDRILIRVYVVDKGGTMGSGTATLYFNTSDGSAGDSYFNIDGVNVEFKENAGSSESPSESPSGSASESPSGSASLSPSASESPSESPSLSPSASESPSESPSLSPSASESPSESPSASPSVSPSESPSESPSASISPSVSPSLSPSASASPSASPSVGIAGLIADEVVYARTRTKVVAPIRIKAVTAKTRTKTVYAVVPIVQPDFSE